MQKVNIIIGTVFLLTLFGGCRKNMPENTPFEMDFKATVWDESETKTGATTAQNLSVNGNIRVYSYLMKGTIEGCGASPYFIDQMVYSNGSWNTPTLRYWPSSTVGNSPTQSISFFAYHPASAELTVSDIGFTSGTGNPTFQYTTPDVESHSDIIVASALCRNYVEGGGIDNKTVNLSFNHIFTKVGFFAKATGVTPSTPTVVLKSVKLIGVLPTSTYTFGSGWGDLSGTPTDYPALSSDLTLTAANQNLLGSGKFMFLIPQPLTNISLEAQYSIGGGAVTTKTVSLAASEVWTAGKGITFHFTFEAASDGTLTLNLNIVPWTSVNIGTEIK